MRPVAFSIALLALALLAWAQPPFSQNPAGPPPQQAQQDDPSDAADHAVARLSLVQGSVTVTRDSGESIPSTVNSPLEAADRVSTFENSRSEIQFDAANIIRLGANTSVRIGDLQYHRYLVQINQGTTLFRVLRDTDAQVQISTPSASVAPLRQGVYRVTVRPDGSSEITVRAGEADLISASGTERLPAGQTMLSRGAANDAEFMNTAAVPYDEWDRWNADRDRTLERAPDASRYAAPDIDGTQELGSYGRWVWDPSYGYVWVPNSQPADWAPYQNGRWDNLDYYGWSWTSYEPWGWAPYHYGNWYRGGFGWAWYPGAFGPHHYWRPAMVGFFGFGDPAFGVSLGFGYGNIGWVPLAPFERFHPWYGRGFAGHSLAIASNTNIASVYRNARFSGAVTGLRATDFGRAGVTRSSFVRPGAGELARAGMVNGGMPLAPARSFNTSRSPNVVRLGGAGSTANSGGWRRLDSQPGAPAVSASRADVRSFQTQRAVPQPVRISPNIVNSRYPGNASPGNTAGGFGGSRPSGGPGFGTAPSSPRSYGGGGTARGPGGGGAPHGAGAAHSSPAHGSAPHR